MTAARYVRLGMGIVGHTLGGGLGGSLPPQFRTVSQAPGSTYTPPPTAKILKTMLELGWGTFQAAQCEPPVLGLSSRLSYLTD